MPAARRSPRQQRHRLGGARAPRKRQHPKSSRQLPGGGCIHAEPELANQLARPDDLVIDRRAAVSEDVAENGRSERFLPRAAAWPRRRRRLVWDAGSRRKVGRRVPSLARRYPVPRRRAGRIGDPRRVATAGALRSPEPRSPGGRQNAGHGRASLRRSGRRTALAVGAAAAGLRDELEGAGPGRRAVASARRDRSPRPAPPPGAGRCRGPASRDGTARRRAAADPGLLECRRPGGRRRTRHLPGPPRLRLVRHRRRHVAFRRRGVHPLRRRGRSAFPGLRP